VVHVPETGPALFSDPVDLKEFTSESDVSLTVALRDGARVEGTLDSRIPRPIKNGHVHGQSVFGIPEKGTWSWASEADVKEDGTFVFESVPPDVTLQVLAYCEGWISQSTTADELRSFKSRAGFWASDRGMEEGGTTRPRLQHVSSGLTRMQMRMEPTADCEVTLVDERDQPVSGAQVAFSPNVTWFNGGSSMIGSGGDSLDWSRQRLALGHDPENGPPPMSGFNGMTNAEGQVVIRNLPASSAQMFMVAHQRLTVRDPIPEYAAIGMPGGFQKASLTAGELTKIRVPMTTDVGPLMIAEPAGPPVRQ
jgi:hypothetical protein